MYIKPRKWVCVMCLKQILHYLKPGVLLPARILFILIDVPWMQLSATDTLKICPPFKDKHPKLDFLSNNWQLLHLILAIRY